MITCVVPNVDRRGGAVNWEPSELKLKIGGGKEELQSPVLRSKLSTLALEILPKGPALQLKNGDGAKLKP